MDEEEGFQIDEPKDFAFQALSSLRETISIAKRQPSQVTYESALDIIYELDPKAYNHISELLTKRNKSEEVRYYSEKAEALSTQENLITPTELIQKDLEDIENALNKGKVKGTSLTKKKITLLGALEYFKPRKVSEHKILNRDFYLSTISLPDALQIYKDEKFVDYKLADDRFLRLRMLHPDEEEAILGADLIYEQYDFTKERVRFIHIQFKLWGKSVLYLNQGNLKNQVNKICENLCNSGFCDDENKNHIGSGYRFPFCSGFLRPTDKQIENEKDMTSTGIHLPVCAIKRMIDETIVKIDKSDVKFNSLNQTSFNELFVNGFIGSRWMPIEELQKFYKDKNIDDHVNIIRVHAQEVLMETESKKAKETEF